MKQQKVLFLGYALTIVFVSFLVFYVVPAFRGNVNIKSGFFLGPLHIRFYGLIMALAILVSWFTVLKLARKRGISLDKVENALFWTTVFGFLGARAYYVIFSWDFFRNNPVDIFKIWEGGLAIFGAIIFGLLGAFFYARKSGLSLVIFLDLLAVALPLGQAIGRWGNFFNQEAFGAPTDLPWKMFVSEAARPAVFEAQNFFHPTFLYESAWNLFVFAVLFYIFRKDPKPGLLIGNYLILYSIGRFFIQPLRVDSLTLGPVLVDQITSLLFILAGTMLIFHSKYGSAGFRKIL